MEKLNFTKKMKALGKKVGNRESPDPAPVIEQPRLSADRAQQKSGHQNLPFQECNDQNILRTGLQTLPDAKRRPQLPDAGNLRAFLEARGNKERLGAKIKRKR